jgi:hypothetical protein
MKQKQRRQKGKGIGAEILGALGGVAGGVGGGFLTAGNPYGVAAGGAAGSYAAKSFGQMIGLGKNMPNTGAMSGLNPAMAPTRSSANKNMKGMKGGRHMTGGQGGMYVPRGYMPGLRESIAIGITQPSPIMRGGLLMGFPNYGVTGAINMNSSAMIR